MIELGRRQKASLQPMTCHCFLARSNLSRSLMISFTRMFSPQPTCLNPVHIFCKQLPLGPLTVRSACRRCLCRCWNFASHSAPCVLEQGLDFHKNWSESLARRRLCLGPTGIINCTPLSALSFWVSLFPGTRGYNIWCIGRETPHFEKTGLIWDRKSVV